MANREVISYNKDFLTGKFTSEKKLKSDSGIKGKVLVELFDAKTNQKVKETYTENLIPDLFYKDIFYMSFVNGIMGAGDTRTPGHSNWFNYIYLTDHDKLENANEQRVMGNIIGYAHRNSPYSGTDTLRGTINRAESRFEVTDNKIKMNFVFDFPTHSANGIFESIYWAHSIPDDKDYGYIGSCIYGRETGDLEFSINKDTNPRRYWVVYLLFDNATEVHFTSPTKGWILFDAKKTSVTQTSYLQFPEELKGHWLMMPFDLNINDIVIWDQIIKLLNSDGQPLAINSSDPIKKHDGLRSCCPYIQPDGNLVFIGHYIYSISSEYYLRIYKWSKVGVQLSWIDINMTQNFKDVDYNTPLNYIKVSGEGIFLDGCLDIMGYTSRLNEQYNENVYTSRWIRVDSTGEKVQDMNIKPKIGNSTWFEKKGMDSGNIERRARISTFYRSKNRIYLSYTGVQTGSSFYQVITPQGNLLEPYRMRFGVSGSLTYHNILGTDNWITKHYGSNKDSILIRNMLTSRPIGAHTKLAQSVEKTDNNTMKIQYMFEIDLLKYGEDYF